MRITLLIMAPFILSSCLANRPWSLTEALLIQSSTENRRIIENAIGDLLNSQPIKLADNVFTKQSIVIIERSQSKDHQGKVLTGREVRQADTFSLLSGDENCYVRHEQSGDIKLLVSIRCQPAEL
jgi:hypothetical protein